MFLGEAKERFAPPPREGDCEQERFNFVFLLAARHSSNKFGSALARSVGSLSSCPKIFQIPYLFTTVQPSGMPLVPVSNVAATALVNVPVEATPDTQSFKQPDADISVASIVMLLRFVQP